MSEFRLLHTIIQKRKEKIVLVVALNWNRIHSNV